MIWNGNVLIIQRQCLPVGIFETTNCDYWVIIKERVTQNVKISLSGVLKLSKYLISNLNKLKMIAILPKVNASIRNTH